MKHDYNSYDLVDRIADLVSYLALYLLVALVVLLSVLGLMVLGRVAMLLMCGVS